MGHSGRRHETLFISPNVEDDLYISKNSSKKVKIKGGLKNPPGR